MRHSCKHEQMLEALLKKACRATAIAPHRAVPHHGRGDSGGKRRKGVSQVTCQFFPPGYIRQGTTEKE